MVQDTPRLYNEATISWTGALTYNHQGSYDGLALQGADGGSSTLTFSSLQGATCKDATVQALFECVNDADNTQSYNVTGDFSAVEVCTGGFTQNNEYFCFVGPK